jgi:hypothetical protein|tara:strand:- start:13 stop:177 length:165 start_codon:yes stop_codon:yes gene_type:complete
LTHQKDEDGDDKDSYEKMIEKFREDIEPDVVIGGLQKEKRATLEPFFDEEKKEK